MTHTGATSRTAVRFPNWMRRLAWVLDDAFPVPGTNGRRVGVDGFLTLIPGIGDAAGLVLSMIVVTAGVAAGVRSRPRSGCSSTSDSSRSSA